MFHYGLYGTWILRLLFFLGNGRVRFGQIGSMGSLISFSGILLDDNILFLFFTVAFLLRFFED